MKILKFNAVWCSGCLVMKKTIKEIKELYPEIEFIDYDYDLDEKEVINGINFCFYDRICIYRMWK